MRIDHLELTNFKNFGRLSVDFLPGVNLLVGGNGSGKTSLLEGINVAVGGFFASRTPKFRRPIKDSEIRIVKGHLPNRSSYVSVFAKSAIIDRPWIIKKNQEILPNEILIENKVWDKETDQSFAEFKKELRKELIKNKDKIPLYTGTYLEDFDEKRFIFGGRGNQKRFVRYSEFKIIYAANPKTANDIKSLGKVAPTEKEHYFHQAYALLEKFKTFLKEETIFTPTKVIDINPIKEYGEQFYNNFENNEDRTVAPLIAYYSTQRLFSDAKQTDEQKYDAPNGRRNGYLQCLDEHAIKPVLDEWLGKAVTLRATKQIKDIESKDKILDNVELAIRKTIIDCMGLAEDFLKIYQNPFFDNELFLEYDNEHDLPLSYYSDGFRNLIYLVIDMVWRASHLNPWLDLEQIKAQVTGVVTIDEIDLHLHPKWQAKAIGLIQGLFPNVQFFITTHSPTVVANFEKGTKGALYIIDDNEVRRSVDKFFGKQIDTVLREVLGAPDRHIPTQIKIDQLFRKIDTEEQEDEINILLSELTQLLGEDDAEIQRARSLIEWNKIKNEDSDAVHQ